MDELQVFNLEILVPDDWRTLPAVICTKTSLGWNGCVPLGIEMMGEALELRSNYAVSGEDLQVWLLDSNATVAAPLAQLGTIAAADIEAVSETTSPDLSLRLEGAEDVSELLPLIAKVESGAVLLTVRRP